MYSVKVKAYDIEGRQVQYEYLIQCINYDVAHIVYTFYKSKQWFSAEPPEKYFTKGPVSDINLISLEDWRVK